MRFFYYFIQITETRGNQGNGLIKFGSTLEKNLLDFKTWKEISP